MHWNKLTLDKAIMNALESAGIIDLDILCSHSESDLLKIDNLGERRVEKIELELNLLDRQLSDTSIAKKYANGDYEINSITTFNFQGNGDGRLSAFGYFTLTIKSVTYCGHIYAELDGGECMHGGYEIRRDIQGSEPLTDGEQEILFGNRDYRATFVQNLNYQVLQKAYVSQNEQDSESGEANEKQSDAEDSPRAGELTCLEVEKIRKKVSTFL